MGVASEQTIGQGDLAITREIAHGHTHDLETDAGSRFDAIRLLSDEADQGRTNVSAAEHTDAHDLPLRFNRCHGVKAMGGSVRKHRGLRTVGCAARQT